MIKHPEQGLLCAEILRKHDPDRILFATDTPWSEPIQEMAFIESLGLGALAVDRIFHGNAVDLLRSCGFDAE
jgi:predicted TIM-barrel fold metal-dependent hydrolase